MIGEFNFESTLG